MPVPVQMRESLIAAAVIAVLAAAAYANALGGAFVWDDKLLVEKNPALAQGLDGAARLFTRDLFHGLMPNPTGYYRPLQVISYIGDYALWGKTPWGFHLTSMILQMANAFLVFLLVRIVSGAGAALFTSAVFAVHPAFAPIATYISGRADLLGLCFALVSLYGVITYCRDRRVTLLLWAAPLFYLAAVLSKEYYLAAPLCILLHVAVFPRRESIRTDRPIIFVLAAMGIIAAGYALARATFLNFHQSMGALASGPAMERLAIAPYVLARYIQTLAVPLELTMERRLTYASLFEGRFVLAYLVPVAVGAALGVLWRRKTRAAFFWATWACLAIAPVLNIFLPLKAVWAEHWAYMASIGFFASVATVIAEGVKGRSRALRRVAAAAGAAYCLLMAILMVYENRTWVSEEALYGRMLQKSPAARVRFNMGKVFEDKGDHAQAIAYYDRAIEGLPRGEERAFYVHARGRLNRTRGEMERARRDLEEAAYDAPTVALYRNDLGCIYAELGMVDKARAEWREVLKLEPDNEMARKNLAVGGGGG